MKSEASFHTVLCTLVAFANQMIKPPSLEETPSEILRNIRYYPWSKNCIDATEDTHIPSIVPTKKAVMYRFGRKNECRQTSWLLVPLKCVSCGYGLGGRALPATFVCLQRLQQDRITHSSPTTKYAFVLLLGIQPSPIV